MLKWERGNFLHTTMAIQPNVPQKAKIFQTSFYLIIRKEYNYTSRYIIGNVQLACSFLFIHILGTSTTIYRTIPWGVRIN